MQVFMPPEIASIYDLLSLLANPSAAKERLDALAQETVNARKFLSEVEETNARTAELAAKNAADVEEARQCRVKAEADRKRLDDLAIQLADKEAELKQRETVLAVAKAEQGAAFYKREAEIHNREIATTAKEQRLVSERAQFEAERSALNRKLAKMREAEAA